MSAPTGWAPPPYAASLGDVLPAVLASLGIELPHLDRHYLPQAGAEPGSLHTPRIVLPPVAKAVVALVDGLGSKQLRRRSGHAPFLRTLSGPLERLRSGFPSTTATSLASLGTGLSPGQHGLIGTMGLMPSGAALFSHLSWDSGPDPVAYQPAPTLLARAARAGVAVTTVSRGAFAGSALTRAALGGGAFVGAETSADRVAATLAALNATPGPALVYLYLDEVDKAGHTAGPDSWQWGEAVEGADRTLRDVATALPAGTSLTVTADHGMIEAPFADRFDLATNSDLNDGVALLGGDPRAGHVFCRPGARDDVLARWRGVLGEAAVLATREAAIDQGWFGAVRDAVRPRIGDVVTAMTGAYTVLDSRDCRPAFLGLIGHHGSLSDDETLIPLLHHVA